MRRAWHRHGGRGDARKPADSPHAGEVIKALERNKPRDIYLVVGLIFVGIVLGRFQTTSRTAGRSDFITGSVRTILSPATGVMTAAANGFEEFSYGFTNSSRLAAENRMYKQKEAAFELYEDRIGYYLDEISKLRKLIDLPDFPGKKKIPALVVSFAPLENRMMINKGTADGVKPALPVIAGDGLVGVVQTADARSAQVLLISSPQIRVGAVVNRQPSPYGIIRGESPNKMSLEIIGVKSTVKIGDLVLTSGLGELIPGGIPIGVVSQTEVDEEYGAVHCQVFPNVLVGDVREVIVLR